MIHIQRFGIEIWINLQKQTNILMRRAILTLNSSENISKILWNSLHILASWCLNDFFIEFKSLNLNFCYWVEPRTLMLIEVHFALKGSLSTIYVSFELWFKFRPSNNNETTIHMFAGRYYMCLWLMTTIYIRLFKSLNNGRKV